MVVKTVEKVISEAAVSSAEGDAAPAEELALRLGVAFDGALFTQALTHRSFAFENGGLAHNERLEFLGDSVLGQAVTVMLYNRFPDIDEGELAKRRSSLVSSAALAEVARYVDIGDYVRLGRGETLTGGREKTSILADTVDAIIGAVYLSAGGDAARDLVLRLVRPLLEEPGRFEAANDPKSLLQEAATARGETLPAYTIETSGPDHARRFTATVTIGGLATGTGGGSSKKQAEMAAARHALGCLS